MRTRIKYLCAILLLISQQLTAQTVKEISSTFEEYFKEKETRSNLTMLKNYLDDKDDERQEVLSQIDDINARLKISNIDTNVISKVENTIQSALANNPGNNGIFSAKELRPEILATAAKFGRGTYAPKNSTDTSFRYNLKLLQSDIAVAVTAYKTDVNNLNILNRSLKAINSDRQKAEHLIQSIYTVEKGNIDFKTKVSVYFSGIIVVLLIVFFVFIYLKSEHGVANEFLSGNGIQFVALFSLIIAIVLFGILGVLEGRELAAILSGISGFILGKGLTKSEDKSAFKSAPAITLTPAAPKPGDASVIKNDEPSVN